MPTETTKKKKNEEKKRAYTHIHNKRQEKKKEDEFITVERRGIECRARMRKLCLDNDETFCRKIYIYRNTLIQ